MEFIYDRTQNDVDYARENPDSKEFLKGNLNYIDLNRIEQNYIELANKLQLLGKTVYIDPIKTFSATLYQEIYNKYATYADLTNTGLTYEELLNEDKWTMNDLIFIEHINRIRDNVKVLKDKLSINGEIEYTNTLNYKQLNFLEKILNDIYIYSQDALKTFKYTGIFYCGEESIAY